MFKVLHVAAKRHLLRMGREEGGGEGSRGSLGAIVTQTSGGKYLFVQQEETCAQGRGRNQFSNGNWFRFEAWHSHQAAGGHLPSTWQSPLPHPRCTLRPCAHASNIRTFPATNLPIDKRGSSKSVCVCLVGGGGRGTLFGYSPSGPFERTLTSCLPLNLWVYEFVN